MSDELAIQDADALFRFLEGRGYILPLAPPPSSPTAQNTTTAGEDDASSISNDTTAVTIAMLTRDASPLTGVDMIYVRSNSCCIKIIWITLFVCVFMFYLG